MPTRYSEDGALHRCDDHWFRSDRLATELFSLIPSYGRYRATVEVDGSDVISPLSYYTYDDKINDREVELIVKQSSLVGNPFIEEEKWYRGFFRKNLESPDLEVLYVEYTSVNFDNNDYVILFRRQGDIAWILLHRSTGYAGFPIIYGIENGILKMNLCLDCLVKPERNRVDVEIDLHECLKNIGSGCSGKITHIVSDEDN